MLGLMRALVLEEGAQYLTLNSCPHTVLACWDESAGTATSAHSCLPLRTRRWRQARSLRMPSSLLSSRVWTGSRRLGYF